MKLLKILKEYAKLSSAHLAFLTALIPVTGAIAMGETRLFTLFILFVIGLLAHIFGFAFNHYNDIEVDTIIIKEVKRPLATGSINKKHALLYMISVFLLAGFLTFFYFGFKLLILILLAGFFATIYDIFSKKIIGMDFILASSVMIFVIFGSATVSFDFSSMVLIIFILAFIHTINLNLIAGGIKDADHDFIFRSKHIASRLGVKVENDVLFIPFSFKLIAYFFTSLYSLFILIPVLFNVIPLNFFLFLILVLINIIFHIINYKMLNLKRFKRQEIRKYVILQYNINWLNIPIILMSINQWAGLLLLLPIFGLIVSNVFIYGTIFRPQVW